MLNTIDHAQPRIKGTSSLLAIMGDPVKQVKSTDMVNQALFDAGIDAVLIPLQVPASGLGRAITSLSHYGRHVLAGQLELILEFLLGVVPKRQQVRIPSFQAGANR